MGKIVKMDPGKSKRELEGHLEKLHEMGFDEFKNDAIEFFGSFWEAIFDVGEALVAERKRLDDCLEVIAEKTQERDALLGEAFEKQGEQVGTIARMVFTLACKAKEGGTSREDREAISGLLGFKWTDEDEKQLFKSAAMAEVH
jgi:hypothetical protein